MTISINEAESWLRLLARSASTFGLTLNIATVRQQLRVENLARRDTLLEKLAALMGLELNCVKRHGLSWGSEVTPVIITLEDGTLVLIETVNRQGIATYWVSEGRDLLRQGSLRKLLSHAQDEVVLIGTLPRKRYAQTDEMLTPWKRHWFWRHFRVQGRGTGNIWLTKGIGD
ncbi:MULTISPECIES: hypothetical protein [Atlantibacter]|uniref:hypothetical protein n=1 Tax=Atlantibacter TaxID=1903434 RepID=UPI0019348EC2|nr:MULTISPECIES: hypothetical protein [Atlantibacter]MBL7635183.1 hypothetical protein [Atlantibacter hermannii]MBL7673861.1 hypothetical protein [Atlantibacter hermannii]MCZ7835219.1 hypothetical protein [Atlantibacter hermannii]